MFKVFIWGTGYWGEKCFNDILPEVDVIGFVESRAVREDFHGKKVISAKELAGYEYDYLILANTHEDEIVQEFGIDQAKVLYYRLIPRPDVRDCLLIRSRIRRAGRCHIFHWNATGWCFYTIRLTFSCRMQCRFINQHGAGTKWNFSGSRRRGGMREFFWISGPILAQRPFILEKNSPGIFLILLLNQ